MDTIGNRIKFFYARKILKEVSDLNLTPSMSKSIKYLKRPRVFYFKKPKELLRQKFPEKT